MDDEDEIPPDESEDDSPASRIIQTAAVELTKLFQANGHVAALESSCVHLPQWKARFTCRTSPEKFPCNVPTVIIGVAAELTELIATPIVVYQLGIASSCPIHGFTDPISEAVSDWYTMVWPVLRDALRFSRGEAIEPHSTIFQTQHGNGPTTMALPFWVFTGPPIIVSKGEESDSTTEKAVQALLSQLHTWGLFGRLLSAENELQPDQGVWWVKAYLGRESSGEVFAEVKWNNETSVPGWLTLMHFPWPEEVRGSATYKQFFVVLKGKEGPLPQLQPSAIDPNECYFKKCPVCGGNKVRVLIPAGEDDNMWKFSNFRLVQDRQCKDCGRRWTPACPRWAAYGYALAGFIMLCCVGVFTLWSVMRHGEKGLTLGLIFGLIPGVIGCVALVHGVGTLFGRLGRLRLR